MNRTARTLVLAAALSLTNWLPAPAMAVINGTLDEKCNFAFGVLIVSDDGVSAATVTVAGPRTLFSAAHAFPKTGSVKMLALESDADKIFGKNASRKSHTIGDKVYVQLAVTCLASGEPGSTSDLAVLKLDAEKAKAWCHPASEQGSAKAAIRGAGLYKRSALIRSGKSPITYADDSPISGTLRRGEIEGLSRKGGYIVSTLSYEDIIDSDAASTCKGDSGGALTVNDGRPGALAGLVQGGVTSNQRLTMRFVPMTDSAETEKVLNAAAAAGAPDLTVWITAAKPKK